MFDLFRAKGIPDEYMVTVSLPIVNEFSNTFSKLPEIETWHVIYGRLFEEGILTGYIWGASEVVNEKACDDFNVKKDFFYRHANKMRLSLYVVDELFGDTVHAQQHRDMLTELTIGNTDKIGYFDGIKCGVADANEFSKGDECSHHLRKALEILDYENLYQHVKLQSLIEYLKINPLIL